MCLQLIIIDGHMLHLCTPHIAALCLIRCVHLAWHLAAEGSVQTLPGCHAALLPAAPLVICIYSAQWLVVVTTPL